MSVWSRTMTAIRAFYNAFTDPEAEASKLTREQRLDRYRQAWAYYQNEMFSTRNGADWSTYLSDRSLYKHIRLIFNPVPNIVDFYSDNLWKAKYNDQYPSLITPLIEDTDDRLVKAIAQLDQWGNWQSEQQKAKIYTASVGNCLVEGIDDLDNQKIYHKIVWAGYVKDVELDSNGNVQSYILEYEVYDTQLNRNYLYRKEVTKEEFRYFRDDRPFIPQGKTAEVEPNPYGFCFAVWMKHKDLGGTFGQSAVTDFNKVDEINGLASHLHDNIHKEIESGKVIGIEDTQSLKVLSGASTNKDGSINETDPRLDRLLLMAKGNVSVADLSGLLKLAEAHPYLKELILSFGSDYPELEYKQILKESAQLSGIALERLLTPAQNRLDGVQGYYNNQLTKLRQMQIAVAGMRSNGGGWFNLSNQQRLFNPFSLNSYSQGNLDFRIQPSKLITLGESEHEELLTKKAQRAKQLEGIVDKREQLKIAGYQDSEIEEIIQRREAEITEQQQQFEQRLSLQEQRQSLQLN